LNIGCKGAAYLPVGILYSHFTERGGAENVILKQVDMLHHKGYDVKCYFAFVDKKLVKPSSNPHCYVDEYFDNGFLRSKTLRILLSLPLAPVTMKKLAEADVLICHGYGPGPWIGYIQKRLRDVKYISYIHFLPRMFYLSKEEKTLWRFDKTRDTVYLLGKVSEPLVKKIDVVGVSNSDAVLVNSGFTGRRAREAYGVEPTVCYPPVDTAVFRRIDREETEQLRQELGWPIVFSSGRIVAIKHWEWLVRTLVHVKKTYPSVTLAISGDVPTGGEAYIYELMNLAQQLGVRENIRFLGFKSLEDLIRLYNVADVYAYPTPMEDFGLGPVEAMACGTPAVVWDDGGGPCETTIDGPSAFRARPYDFEDFAEKTMKAFDIDKESIGDRLHRYVEGKFSSERHLEILDKTLRTL
jgi:glycosyltransferase involved in cell wall biosynthesis